VVVAGMPRPGPATLVDQTLPIRLVDAGPQWASRAGAKLAEALEVFALDPAGRTCLDVGASTGGFTDVLLERGAAAVVAVDVGYGQLLWRLRTDSRVTVHDRTNFRHADPVALGAPFDLVVIDVSFISVGLLAGKLAAAGRAGADYVVLVKPQFEVGKAHVGRGGLVTDPVLHAGAMGGVAAALAGAGIGPLAVCRSPITGASGNHEFLLHGVRGAAPTLVQASIEEVANL